MVVERGTSRRVPGTSGGRDVPERVPLRAAGERDPAREVSGRRAMGGAGRSRCVETENPLGGMDDPRQPTEVRGGPADRRPPHPGGDPPDPRDDVLGTEGGSGPLPAEAGPRE